jgi:hypothetical protein
VAASNVVGGRGELWVGGAKLASFRVDSGSINIERNNAARRTCQVSLTNGELVGSTATAIPTRATDLFAPFGNELILYYTKITNGVEVDTQCGVFGLDDVDINDSADDLAMSLTADDRSTQYSQCGFADVYTIAASTNVGTAIQALLTALPVGFPQVFNFSSTTAVTQAAPTVFGPGDDPWGKCRELAQACGFALYMDPIGRTTFAAVPDPVSAAIAASFDEGNSNTAVTIKRSLSRRATPNYIIRDGQGTGITAPVRGLAIDTNPLSPTYVNGRYGRVVDYQSSSLYATQAQAQAAAAADLLLAQGRVERVDLTVVPNPALDVDSVVEVTRVRSGIVAGTKYVVDSISLNFDPGTLQGLSVRAIAGIL